MAVLLVIANIGGYLCYRNAEKVWAAEVEMRKRQPFKYKLLGFSKKYLDDQEKWVHRYRVFVVIVCACFNLFGLWFFLSH